ncbi:FAD:protein FMN transferase [Bermanella marisrubri]|nr:FAD:protein FMN transferase [Bermanella marisrubri]QIZ84054.1 FAD:protein FMN transferase [Bermanella marisrubri]
MGTTYSVRYYDDIGVSSDELKQEVDILLVEVNRQMSTYQGRSEISQFNQQNAPYEQKISAEFADVVFLSQQLYEMTGGYFDVTVGPLVNLWGFGPDGRPVNPPSEQEVQAALEKTGMDAIKLDKLTLSLSKSAHRYVDLSAIAKGFGVDLVAQLLEAKGAHNYLVEIGGEIRVSGMKPSQQEWKLAVETPETDAALGARSVQKILNLTDAGMATSGDYRNFFEVDGTRYSHTIDPFTGMPSAHSLGSVTVIADTCARADAIATAMLVMGTEKALALAKEHNIAAYFIVRTDNGFQEQYSEAWKTRFN